MLVEIIGKQGNEQLITTTRIVAKEFDKEHSNVVRDIETRYKRLAFCGSPQKVVDLANYLFYRHEFVNPHNKQTYVEYYMNRDGFMLLVMGFTGEKALEKKLEFIEAFNEMESALKRIFEERQKWAMERAKSIYARHVLTDAIKDLVADTPNKKFAYPNYTKLIYKAIWGKSPQELRDEHGLTKPSQSLRDCFTEEELNEVARLEGLVSGLLNYGWSYQQIKEFVMHNTNKRIGA